MQNKRLNRKLIRRIGISIALLIIVAIAIYGVVHRVGKRAENLAALETVEAQWLAHPYSHYRLNIKYSGMLWAGPNYHECTQDVEVTNEQVKTILQDTCKEQGEYTQRFFTSPVTMTGLFAKLKSDMKLDTAENMMCNGMPIVQVNYDLWQKFPVSAVYSTEIPSPDNLGIETYWRLYAIGSAGYNCLASGGIKLPTITVTMEPLFS